MFPKLDDIREDMVLPDNLMERTGYRLPTEGEWESACRAGTMTPWFFGDSDQYLDSYGWHIGNSFDYAWQVGLLKPNDFGLFEVYGNAWEWCLDRHGSLPHRPSGVPFVDAPKLVGTKPCMLRGGSLNSRADALRSAQRDFIDALHNRNHNVFFGPGCVENLARELRMNDRVAAAVPLTGDRGNQSLKNRNAVS